jgi:hypothetical protein
MIEAIGRRMIVSEDYQVVLFVLYIFCQMPNFYVWKCVVCDIFCIAICLYVKDTMYKL